MFEAVPEATDSPPELANRYLAELRDALGDDPGDVPSELQRAVADGDAGELSLDDAAQILANGSERLGAAAIEAELLDRILIEMSNAVVDVDTLAGEIDLDRSGKELQQRIEGRAPMTLHEYAAIGHAIAERRA